MLRDRPARIHQVLSRHAAYGTSTTGSLALHLLISAGRTRIVWSCRHVPPLSAASTLPGVPRSCCPQLQQAAATACWWSRGVGPGRGTGLVTSPFPRPALRTGHATLTASGAPRTPFGARGSGRRGSRPRCWDAVAPPAIPGDFHPLGERTMRSRPLRAANRARRSDSGVCRVLQSIPGCCFRSHNVTRRHSEVSR